MSIKKEDVLNNLEEVKKYILEAEQKKEEKVVGIAIKSMLGNVIFQSTKKTYKEAVEEAVKSNANLRNINLSYANLSYANLSYANLSGADLSDAKLSYANLSYANLRGAELQNAKFYGRGGTKELTKEQVPTFLKALGFIIK